MSFLDFLIPTRKYMQSTGTLSQDEGSESVINSELAKRTAMGFLNPSTAEAAPAESYGNPSTYTPANFTPSNVGNPSTYTPSNPSSDVAYPTSNYSGGEYSAPQETPAQVQPSELDILRTEWEANKLPNLAQFHNGVIAGAKLEYEIAMRNGNRDGMLRAAEKARVEREKAKEDGTFDLLDQGLATNNQDYYSWQQGRQAQEEATRQRMIDAGVKRNYSGYDSKNTDTTRNRYANSDPYYYERRSGGGKG